MRQFITEFIGTFFFVLTAGLAVTGTSVGALSALAMAGMLTAMTYAAGPISGGHLNPAISLAMLVRGRIGFGTMVLYWIAQLLAGLLAALTFLILRGGSVAYPLQPNVGPALLAEFFFTFALCFVFLTVATSRALAGNPFYGVTMGLVMLAGTFAVGSLSGGLLNPALAMGFVLMGLIGGGSLWIYVVATLAAAISAALIFRSVYPK
jgi:aquaporin Z